MPRVGGVMQLLSGTLAVPNTTIQSAPYNAQQNDWVLDANNPRPIAAGGTGATTATQARINLGAIGATDLATAATKGVVVDTDSVVIIDSAASNVNKRWLVDVMRTSLAVMKDDLQINKDSPTITLKRAVNTQSELIRFQHADDTLAWHIGMVGSAAFSEFRISRYVAGAFVDAPIRIAADTGTVTIGSFSTGSFTSVGNITSSERFISSGNTVVLGTATAGTVYLRPGGTDGSSLTGQTVISSSGNMAVDGGIGLKNTLQVTDVSSDAAAGPVFYLDRISPSAFAGDGLGYMAFRGTTSTGITVAYVDFSVSIVSATNGSESSNLVLRNRNAGASRNALTLAPASATIHSPLSVTGSVDITGTMTASSHVYATASAFVSKHASQAVLGMDSGGSGSIYLRPRGYDVSTNQTAIDSSGAILVSSHGAFGPTDFLTTSALAGVIANANGTIASKKVGTAAADHVAFYNNVGVTPAKIGSISSTGSTTSYNPSSDERLKDFIGPIDPLKAIALIRGDPAREYTWKSDGSYGAGWGAQTSYAIDPYLASPPIYSDDADFSKDSPPEPFEAGFAPWTIDPNRRTPFLWAALSWALDRIDELHDRIKTLEEGTPA